MYGMCEDRVHWELDLESVVPVKHEVYLDKNSFKNTRCCLAFCSHSW